MEGVVVGMDGSACAARALVWAVTEAARQGWAVTAVLAWGFPDHHDGIVGEGFDRQHGEGAAKAALDADIERTLGPSGADVQRRTVCDFAARALLEAAADAALLVVGARGVGGSRELLLGAVSEHCLHYATCPVAIVRPATATGLLAGELCTATVFDPAIFDDDARTTVDAG